MDIKVRLNLINEKRKRLIKDVRVSKLLFSLCLCPRSHPRGASGKFPEVNASSISLVNNTERGKQVLSDINKHDAAEKGVIEGRGFCIWDVL